MLGVGVTLGGLALVILAAGGKGSESNRSRENDSRENESFSKSEAKEKKTGAQHKFWIPTYEGTNPLNRRKISITSSEIERYDKSIDVSLSGVNRNKTKARNHNIGKHALSMPILWSGEDEDLNKSRKYDISMESSAISIESDHESSISEESSDSYSVTEQSSGESVSKIPKKKFSAAPESKLNTQKYPEEKLKKKYVQKEIISKFYKELDKTKFNESVISRNYYKQLVQEATENTKKKLGYNKKYNKKDVQKTASTKQHVPNIIKIDTDNYFEMPRQQWEDIEFKTSHKQLNHEAMLKTQKPHSSKANEKLQPLKSNDTAKPSKDDSSSFYDLDAMPTDTEEEEEDDNSFTEHCDYSAWSDILSRNKTDRKANKRKPKTRPISSTYQKSRELKRPLNKEIMNKADKLRKKDGTTRKKKRQRELKKKEQAKKIETKRRKSNDYDNDNYQYDYSQKKIRMRTKGEKHHAINEVKGYLKKMDNKYGGRPGQDTYKSRKDSKGGKRYEKRDRGFKEGERWKGRDRRREGQSWDDGGDRDYRDDGKRDSDSEGRWGAQRGGQDREWREDQRGYERRGTRESYRNRGSGRGRGRDEFRGRGRYRGNTRDERDGRGFRGRDRDSFRGRDNYRGRGRYRNRGSGKGGSRGRRS